jgi:maltose alpha-D-glucosyltransferase/alpha-amylase
LVKALHATRPRPASSQWGMFLRNHDELDLGWLTDKQRQRVFAAFAPEKNMQLYERGIRRRLAPMLGSDRRRMELAYSLMLTLPGTPVLRYGDEIGMGDDLSLPERTCARTAMQWSTEPHGGFTSAEKSLVPVIEKGPYGFEHLNVASQRRDPNSFLNWMERMVRMRKEVPEVGWGDFEVLDVGKPGVLVLRYEWRNNAVLFIHNLQGDPCEVELPAQESHGRTGVLVNLLSEDHSHAEKDGHYCVLMEPYGYHWYRVGGLDYLLERTAV